MTSTMNQTSADLVANIESKLDGQVDLDASGANGAASNVGTPAPVDAPKVINVDAVGDELAQALLAHRVSTNGTIATKKESLVSTIALGREMERTLFLKLWTHSNASSVSAWDVKSAQLKSALDSAQVVLDAIKPEADLAAYITLYPALAKSQGIKLDVQSVQARANKAGAALAEALVAYETHAATDPRIGIVVPTEIAIERGTSKKSPSSTPGAPSNPSTGAFDITCTFTCPTSMRMDISTNPAFTRLGNDAYSYTFHSSSGDGNVTYYQGAFLARVLGYPSNKNGDKRTAAQQANVDAIRDASVETSRVPSPK